VSKSDLISFNMKNFHDRDANLRIFIRQA